MIVPTAPFVVTRFLGATDHRGSRVTAHNLQTGKRKTLPWDYALEPKDNYIRAAQAVLEPGWNPRRCCSARTGYYFCAG